MKLGGVPYEATAARFADWLDGHNARGIHRALPWWTAVADTLSIIRAIDLLRARAASDTGDARVWTAWRLRMSESYLPLARGDTATALRLFEQLPEFRCWYC